MAKILGGLHRHMVLPEAAMSRPALTPNRMSNFRMLTRPDPPLSRPSQWRGVGQGRMLSLGKGVPLAEGGNPREGLNAGGGVALWGARGQYYPGLRHRRPSETGWHWPARARVDPGDRHPTTESTPRNVGRYPANNPNPQNRVGGELFSPQITRAPAPSSAASQPAPALEVPDWTAADLPRGGVSVSDRPALGASSVGAGPPLAYELIQGPLVRWSREASGKSAYSAPPTAVFLHGILGSRKNWSSFARRLAREFPAWQMLLVDLRCHGESSTSLPLPPSSPHTVTAAARDVLRLVGHLKLVPQMLVGHSFGGKVALSMVDQAPKPLAKPVQVWVLDATPGEVHAGGDGEDHPRDLIRALGAMSGPITDRKAVVSTLCSQGFSAPVSQWMTTNLKAMDSHPNRPGRAGAGSSGLEWAFDLDGIAEMYESYEASDLWRVVEGVPEGVRIEFLRAERSLHRWAHGDVQRIGAAELRASAEGAGVRMHVLEDSGHWVHADNPEGLFRILAPSFGGGFPN